MASGQERLQPHARQEDHRDSARSKPRGGRATGPEDQRLRFPFRQFYRAQGTPDRQFPDCNHRGAAWPGVLSRGGIQATEISRQTRQAGAVAQARRDRPTQREGSRLHRRADRLGQGQVSRHTASALAGLVALALLGWRADPFATATDRPWHIRNQAGRLVRD